MATNYLSEAKLTRLANRIETVYLKKADFNTTIADYSTTAQVTQAITDAIDGVTQFDYQVVETLPATGVKGVIYLVANDGSGDNVYDEYLYINGSFELFGTKMIELVDYVGTATVSVADGTGANAGKKVISVIYGSEFQETANGLELSAAVKASLSKADSALQSVTSTGNSVVVTGDGDTKNLEVSQTIQDGAAAGATALQPTDIGEIPDATIDALWATA